MSLKSNISLAAEIVQKSDAILITAGAGIGVDSGLPDFRGDKGFWKAYPPIAKLGISFVDMANPYWFEKDSRLAWAFYGHRLNLYRRTVPHQGFKMLLETADKKPGKYFIFTSNVDGQFQSAGFDSERIEECHGSIHHFQCTRPCRHDIWDANGIIINIDEELFQAQDPLPLCQNCSDLARPNILMFGDWHWIPHRTEAQHQRLSSWLGEIQTGKMKLAIIEIGAGEAVATVRHTSESILRAVDATLIRINPRDYNVPPGHVSIALGALEGIEEIWARL